MKQQQRIWPNLFQQKTDFQFCTTVKPFEEKILIMQLLALRDCTKVQTSLSTAVFHYGSKREHCTQIGEQLHTQVVSLKSMRPVHGDSPQLVRSSKSGLREHLLRWPIFVFLLSGHLKSFHSISFLTINKSHFQLSSRGVISEKFRGGGKVASVYRTLYWLYYILQMLGTRELEVLMEYIYQLKVWGGSKVKGAIAPLAPKQMTLLH